jgi:hypothetical protein
MYVKAIMVSIIMMVKMESMWCGQLLQYWCDVDLRVYFYTCEMWNDLVWVSSFCVFYYVWNIILVRLAFDMDVECTRDENVESCGQLKNVVVHLPILVHNVQHIDHTTKFWLIYPQQKYNNT